jgi:hypothetical protein
LQAEMLYISTLTSVFPDIVNVFVSYVKLSCVGKHIIANLSPIYFSLSDEK